MKLSEHRPTPSEHAPRSLSVTLPSTAPQWPAAEPLDETERFMRGLLWATALSILLYALIALCCWFAGWLKW